MPSRLAAFRENDIRANMCGPDGAGDKPSVCGAGVRVRFPVPPALRTVGPTYRPPVEGISSHISCSIKEEQEASCQRNIDPF